MSEEDFAYYAVRKGRQIGIFLTWPDCRESVENFLGAEYKAFHNVSLARAYLDGDDVSEPSIATIEESVLVMDNTDANTVETSYSFTQDNIPKNRQITKKTMDFHQFAVSIQVLELVGLSVDFPQKNQDVRTSAIVKFDHESIDSYYYGSELINDSFKEKINPVWSGILNNENPRCASFANFSVDLHTSQQNRSALSVENVDLYFPETISLDIGTMKWGKSLEKDEIIILGTANLVISGELGEARTYDLPIKPLSGRSHVLKHPKSLFFKKAVSNSLSSPEKKKVKARTYFLDKGAKLRIRVEVKNTSILPVIPHVHEPDEVSDDENSVYEVTAESRRTIEQAISLDIEAKKERKKKKKVAKKVERKKSNEMKKDMASLDGLEKELNRLDNNDDDSLGDLRISNSIFDTIRNGCTLIMGDIGLVRHNLEDDVEPYGCGRDTSDMKEIAANFAERGKGVCGATCEDLKGFDDGTLSDDDSDAFDTPNGLNKNNHSFRSKNKRVSSTTVKEV